MEKFAIGMALGAIVGAAIVANSQKTRQLVVKSQEELKNKLDDVIDQKLQEFEDDEDEEEDYSNEQSAKRLRKKRRTV